MPLGFDITEHARGGDLQSGAAMSVSPNDPMIGAMQENGIDPVHVADVCMNGQIEPGQHGIGLPPGARAAAIRIASGQMRESYFRIGGDDGVWEIQSMLSRKGWASVYVQYLPEYAPLPVGSAWDF